MKILAFGDVVGKPGRQVLKKHVVCLRRELAVDFVFANGENAAGGIGLTRETLDEILSCGVDAVTGGNRISGSTGNSAAVWTATRVSCARQTIRMLRAEDTPFIPLPTDVRSLCATCKV